MKITKEWLQRKNACPSGIDWFCGQRETDAAKLCNLAIDKKDSDLLSWARWVIIRAMTYKQLVSYAVFAAEQVIDMYEKKYPADDRPRKAIEAAKKCIEHPSEENKLASRIAVAYASTYKVAAASAYAAADTAASNGAYEAEIDAAGAVSFAIHAAVACSGVEVMRKKILEYGIELIRENT